MHRNTNKLINKIHLLLKNFSTFISENIIDKISLLYGEKDKNNRRDDVVMIPLRKKFFERSSHFIVYNHKHIVPHSEKQFKNCYFPNDYTEIEDLASNWNGRLYLKASIITATYNQKDTLKLHLLGWTQQKYPFDLFEIIVADDGSSDGTEELIKEMTNTLPYKLKYYSQEDKGFRLAKVRNGGIALSKGDVVFFVDADTIASPEYIWEHMKYYHVSDKIAVVGMRHRIEPTVNEDTVLNKINTLKDMPMLKDTAASQKVRDWRNNILFNNIVWRKQWKVHGGFHGTLVSCRREDIVGVGGWDESFTQYGQEDTEMAYRLLSKVQFLISNPKARLYHLEHPHHPCKTDPKNKEVLQNKTKPPKVSVYIPVYNSDRNLILNVQKRIEESIQSILKQTLQNIEIIIVNDGSPRSFSKILEKYKYHSKIRILFQKKRTKGAACNMALLYARGDYICQLDPGDLLMPEALSILTKELDDNPKKGLVYAGYYDFFNNKEIKRLPSEYKPGLFLKESTSYYPALWRRICFLQSEGVDENFNEASDLDLFLKLEEICSVKEVSLLLFKKRVHNSLKKIKDYTIALNNALRRRKLKLKAVTTRSIRGWSIKFITVNLV
jgi:glycosyltransferase involved in cell wall biosynthesis